MLSIDWEGVFLLYIAIFWEVLPMEHTRIGIPRTTWSKDHNFICGINPRTVSVEYALVVVDWKPCYAYRHGYFSTVLCTGCVARCRMWLNNCI